MIAEFVELFMSNREELRRRYREESKPLDWKAFIRDLVIRLSLPEVDPDRIHEIDDGEYQGTLVFVIGATGYQPSRYWYVKVDYGSCSGCDALESALSDNSYDDMVTLALHIIQGIKEMA